MSLGHLTFTVAWAAWGGRKPSNEARMDKATAMLKTGGVQPECTGRARLMLRSSPWRVLQDLSRCPWPAVWPSAVNNVGPVNPCSFSQDKAHTLVLGTEGW